MIPDRILESIKISHPRAKFEDIQRHWDDALYIVPEMIRYNWGGLLSIEYHLNFPAARLLYVHMKLSTKRDAEKYRVGCISVMLPIFDPRK